MEKNDVDFFFFLVICQQDKDPLVCPQSLPPSPPSPQPLLVCVTSALFTRVAVHNYVIISVFFCPVLFVVLTRLN